MCAVTDTSSYIHPLRHRVVKDVGEVLPIKLLHKTEAFQDIRDVPAMMDEEEFGGSSCSHPEGEMWLHKLSHNLELKCSLPIYHN